jgi:antitoxin component YwqK of YwqJK toxin-antitoxin module
MSAREQRRRRGGRVAPAAGLAFALGAGLTLGGCTVIQTECPVGTEVQRRIFSGGAEAEWCHRADGVHQGPEVRYYESGARMIEGAYLDGVRHGEWHYTTHDGLVWRRDRWEDGALVEKHVEPPLARPNAAAVDVLAPTDSMIIKLASADPTLGRAARADQLPPFAVWYTNGKPRVLGHYDRDGLRTGTWWFWHEDGQVARQVDYDAGVRHRMFREWHEGGRSKTDGFYIDGERDGHWRRWDAEGRLLADQDYGHGMLPP